MATSVRRTIVRLPVTKSLLDIGYPTEASSRPATVPSSTTSTQYVPFRGDEVEALVLTKKDKEGRLILSKKRAQYERAW